MIDVLQEDWSPETKTLSGRSHVVAGDPYELRIALPVAGSWVAKRVVAPGASIKVIQNTEGGVRVRIDSRSSQEVAWQVEF